jgi:hypothetical protein
MVGTKVRANRSLSYGEASLGEPKLASHPSAHGLGGGELAQALILIPNLKYFESRNFDQKP